MSNKGDPWILEVPAYFVVFGFRITYKFAWKVYIALTLLICWWGITGDLWGEFGNHIFEFLFTIAFYGGFGLYCWSKRNETLLEDVRDLT